jgi:hypothetical protein
MRLDRERQRHGRNVMAESEQERLERERREREHREYVERMAREVQLGRERIERDAKRDAERGR